MKEILITTLVEKTLKEVKDYGYCDNSYKIFEYHYKNLLKYYEEKEIEKYSYDVSIQFLEDKWHLDINKGNFNYWESRKCRSIKMLDDIYKNRTIRIRYSYNQIILNDDNLKILNDYISYNQKIGLSEKNIKGIKTFITKFLKYIENNNLNIKSIDLNISLKFLSEFTNINTVTMKNYIFMLKMFFLYLFDNNIINKNIGYLLPNIKKIKNAKLPSVWNFDDLNKILNSIDNNTNKGKRDLAIIMLAITTTLRASDIINLKLDNIDFENNIINVIQEKTKNQVILPLMNKTKLALIDYIENARPKNTDYKNVFLSCCSIVKPIMNSSALSTMLNNYCNKLGLDHNQKRGIHSLRHTTLNCLFNDNETSLITITEISGHNNPNSLNSYIKTDLKRLSEFTLNINDFIGDINE